MEKYGWNINIHDAWVVSPSAAVDVRHWYAQELRKIHQNREEILRNYFNSIGITSAATNQWIDLQNKVDNLEEDLVVNLMALK